jgi:L-seryl-tRNA(Ser) seleniumtransferase
MHPEVLEAMNAAAGHYVDINALQAAAGKRIAQLTQNEDAYVSANATAGIVLSVLACITRGEQLSIARLPDVGHLPHEVIVHSGHRIPFDPAISVGCGKLVQIGNAYHSTELDLKAAINDRTAAVFYVAGSHVQGALPLADTVQIAHEHNVPVIVDAAAQLPPASNLWHLSSELGADLVIFSGGKDIGGPQASGLIVGKSSLIQACRAVGPPSPYWPRALKTGKEEIMGLLRAIELYVERDEPSYLARLEEVVTSWIDRLGALPGVAASRLVPSLDGQPTPRVLLEIDPEAAHLTAAELSGRLLAHQPPIRVGSASQHAIYLNPETLAAGEDKVVSDQIAFAMAEDPAVQ